MSLGLAGCKTKPAPSEVTEAKLQEQNLWREGAPLYAPEEYSEYLVSSREAKDILIRTKAKFSWLRNYKETQMVFQAVLEEGEKLLLKVEEEKRRRSEALARSISDSTKRIDIIRKLSRMINEGRFARTLILHAELKLRETELHDERGDIEKAEEIIKDVMRYLKDAEDVVFSVLERYREPSSLDKWERWVRETLSESEKQGKYAVIVTKIDRRMAVYKNGRAVMAFDIGLGPNSLADKIHAGDYATPEGKYRIVKKNPASQYYKAFLLDYPNEEDVKRFQFNRREGIIPPGVGIGGLIEIHGGGKNSITNGCISLENKDLDKIFEIFGNGTPVTIVGSTRQKNAQFFGNQH